MTIADMLDAIKETAEALRQTRAEIDVIEKEVEEKVSGLKAKRDELQNTLITLLKQADLASIKVSSGETYTKSVRKGIAIVNEVAARVWARDNNCFSIDRRAVADKLKDVVELPGAFEKVETEYISIRKAKITNEASE